MALDHAPDAAVASLRLTPDKKGSEQVVPGTLQSCLTVSLAQQDAIASASSSAVDCLTESSLLATPVCSGVSQFDQTGQALGRLLSPAEVAESLAKASQQASPLSSASVGKLKQVALEPVRVSAAGSAAATSQSMQSNWPLSNTEHCLHSSPRPDFACRNFISSAELSSFGLRLLGLTRIARIAPGHLKLFAKIEFRKSLLIKMEVQIAGSRLDSLCPFVSPAEARNNTKKRSDCSD